MLRGMRTAFRKAECPNYSWKGVAKALIRKPRNQSWPMKAIEVSDQQFMSGLAVVKP
jgi:hypothetical protein